MKKVAIIFSLLTAVTSLGSTTYAQDNSSSVESSTYSGQIAEKQIQAAATATATLSFRWSALQNRVASNPFSTNGGNLQISVVQWTDDPAGSPVMGYQLVNSSGYEISGLNPILVNGTFRATNTIRTFTNVPAGTYRVRVINYGSYAVTGNGNINY